MLVPINRAGSKPPVFFIHGANGIMPVGGLFSRILGSDYPFYVINAKGFDGSPPHQSFNEMVEAYYVYIVDTAPTGPVVIAAMCWGTLIAIEVARKLLAAQGDDLGDLPQVLDAPIGARADPDDVEGHIGDARSGG